MTGASGTSASSAAGSAPAAGPSHTFAKRITAVLSTKVTVFAIGLATTLVVSRILGPDGKGAYYAIVSLPGLLGAFALFGLPNAVNYFAARGTSIHGLMIAGTVLTALLSTVLVAIIWVSLPVLETSVLKGAKDFDTLLRVMLIAVPAALLSTFQGAVLSGRQQVRTYSAILLGQSLLTLTLSLLLVMVFRLGVEGAVTTSIVVIWALTIADVIAVYRLSAREPGGTPMSYRKLIAYGSRIYPSSITGYFNYRIDVYLIQLIMLAPKGPLGLYSFAVTMAELIFYVPDSVTMIFLPRVAGSTQAQADELLARVARLTVLITAVTAVMIVPAAWIGVNLALPKFVPCFPAYFILLPAVVSLSLAKVLTSYISGRGRPGSVAVGAGVALVVNIAANFVLIGPFGIQGAALASLISYTTLATFMLVVACRISGHSPLALVVPRMSEVRVLRSGAGRVRAALGARVADRRGKPPSGLAGPHITPGDPE